MSQLNSQAKTVVESMKPRGESICPSCQSQGLVPFYEVTDVPVHSCLMLPTYEEAVQFPSGDVLLAYCEHCGFITNLKFDAKWSAYAPNYEDQQSFSPTFNQFARDIAQHLVDRYALQEKDIVEIGCSKGDFLVLLCELGNNRGVGIDPSAIVGRVESPVTERIQFIQDYYSEQYSDRVGDLICCRHTLEHIYPTFELVNTVRRSIGDRATTVFFEIPDMQRVLQEVAFEDIYYEHCSYFTPGSLARLFRSCHFEVVDLYRAYGEQYLMIEAKPVSEISQKVFPLEENVADVIADVKHFANNIEEKLKQWQEHLESAQAAGKRLVIWGSGSKCVAFLTTLKAIDCVEYIVDINPHRHGKFIPGVGKEIMPPAFLKEYQPDEIIIMNSIYTEEIKKMLNEMGVETEVTTL